MIWNSLKQFFRTPVKTVAFFVLLTASGILLSLGGRLWINNSRSIGYYEEVFTTVGTVEQRESSMRQWESWNVIKNDYKIWMLPHYQEILPLSLLDFEEADYIYKPEKQPAYSSYMPDCQLESGDPSDWLFLVLFTPLENCIPGEPVKVRIKKVFNGVRLKVGDVIYFCDRYTPEPKMLHKGKTYVAEIAEGGLNESIGEYEYWPSIEMNSTQYDKSGNYVQDAFTEISPYYEVTEGFWDTEIGKRWKEYMGAFERQRYTFTVTATNATDLLLPFHNGDAFISEGRDILPEEYGRGDKICLVSKKFAENNQLSLGSSLHLQLYCASYGKSFDEHRLLFEGNLAAGYFSLLNAEGKRYPVFEDSSYKIVGIYETTVGSRFEMDADGAVIPMHSVKHSDANNIVSYAPMQEGTTSFRIQNGQIEQFMKAWESHGTDQLKITFYDGGYTKLKEGLEKMKQMSSMLFAIGLIMLVVILLFFCHIFIGKQKMNTAIRRSLGLNKKNCMHALMPGVLALLIVGSILGCYIGGVLSSRVSVEDLSEVYYSAKYSDDMANSKMTQDEGQTSQVSDFWDIAVLCIGMIVAGTFLALFEANRNLKYEPLQLLAKQDE